MIHREGYGIVLGALIAVVVLSWGFNSLHDVYLLKIVTTLALWVVFFLILQFFRNPKRGAPGQELNEVIAPADGKVVVIEETDEGEFLKDRRIQISIFMSPLNVHVNRNPIAGIVKYAKYHKGKYLVAWHPKSSKENERTTVVIENKFGPILFRQIAGAVARRIKFYVNEGDEVRQAEEMGFIKFGSRVDVFLPLDAEILVSADQKTRGGETVLARLK